MKYQGRDKSKIILGIDPGSIICGYGLIRTASEGIAKKSPGESVYVASGRIVLSAKHPLNFRLKELFDGLTDIIRAYSPDEVVVEKVFFAKGIKAALILGQARGAALVAAAKSGIPVYEYSALEVKKAIVGYGRAEKHQVQKMVSDILDLDTRLSKDSADALALALCHNNSKRIYK